MARYQHIFPAPRKQRYARLFTAEDKAKITYNKDMRFRRFVNEWHDGEPELMGWTLTDFYTAYVRGGYQMIIAF